MPPGAEHPMKRTCPCGSVLASDNRGVLCVVCQRAVRDGERGAGNAAVARKARAVVDAYAVPERHISGEMYLEALTASLDELCRALHVRLPKLEGTRLESSYRSKDVKKRRSA